MSSFLNCFSDDVFLSYICTHNKLDVVRDSEHCLSLAELESKSLAVPIQRHTNNVIWTSDSGEYPDCDGIISNLGINLFISLSVADCVPVCLFDPVTKNFGLVHSGWRGTTEKISLNAIKVMCDNRSREEDIEVYMGPSISKEHYEVDADVALLFNRRNYTQKNDKYMLDIKNQIRDDLVGCGIKIEKINSSDICTFRNKQLPSYRRDGNDSGRIIFIMGKSNG